MKPSRIMIACLLICFAIILSFGCSDATGNTTPPLQVGIVYVSTPGAMGESYMHEMGTQGLESHFGERIHVTRMENIPENGTSALAFDFLVDEGCSIIFGTSYNYQEYMQDVAQEHPEVRFEHCSGYLREENMSSYYGRMYQARYLTGIIAGSMTESDKIGYVAPFATPDIVRGINAFTLGVRSANPDATVTVQWSGTWFNATTEGQKAQDLISLGCDVLAQHQDTSAVASAAISAGKYAIGYNADFRAMLEDDKVLVSSLWSWERYMIPAVQAVLDGTWESQDYWGGFEDDMIRLSTVSPLVPLAVKQLVEEKQSAMANQTFDVFWGELKDTDGTIRQSAEGKMSDTALRTMNWFVQGVIDSDD